MAWRCWHVWQQTFVSPNNSKHKRRLTFIVPDPSQYRQAVCKLFTKLGDFLSAGRRKSWVGDQIWSKHVRGFYFHEKIKHFLLYRRFIKGIYRWHNGETYEFKR